MEGGLLRDFNGHLRVQMGSRHVSWCRILRPGDYWTELSSVSSLVHNATS